MTGGKAYDHTPSWSTVEPVVGSHTNTLITMDFIIVIDIRIGKRDCNARITVKADTWQEAAKAATDIRNSMGGELQAIILSKGQ